MDSFSFIRCVGESSQVQAKPLDCGRITLKANRFVGETIVNRVAFINKRVQSFKKLARVGIKASNLPTRSRLFKKWITLSAG